MKITEFNPFLYHSNKLQALFIKAAKQKDPAMWLYKNDARTSLFMLEALTRLHDNAFDEKLFSKWNKGFKKLEDGLGQVDHFLGLDQEFKNNKKINKEIESRFANNATKWLAKCNKRLSKKDWLENKLLVFDVKLNEFEVVYNKTYMDELKIAIKEEIEDLMIFLEKINYTFTRLEEELHEVRRRLRWLSIYAQALNGLIQIKKTTKKNKYKFNYLTKESLSSPFNKLPAKPKGTAIIEFDSNSFYALSWIINELGKLKDIGIRVEELSNAIFLYEDITEYQAKIKAAKILGVSETIEDDVLKKASEIVKGFVLEDKMLDTLLVK